MGKRILMCHYQIICLSCVYKLIITICSIKRYMEIFLSRSDLILIFGICSYLISFFWVITPSNTLSSFIWLIENINWYKLSWNTLWSMCPTTHYNKCLQPLSFTDKLWVDVNGNITLLYVEKVDNHLYS